MSRSLTRSQAVVLAVVVLAGLGLGTFGLFAAGNRHWVADAFHVRAALQDIGGVEAGTRVRIQGIDAGEVIAVEPPATPGANVLLKLRLAGKYRPLVTADARVEVAAESLLGGKVVRIVPGSAGAPAVEDDAVLAGGPPADLGHDLSQAAAKLNKVLTEADATLAEFRRGEGPVGKAAKDLTQTTARLNRVLAEVDGVVQDVRGGKGTLGKLLQDDSLYGQLTGTLGEVRTALEDVRYGKGTLGKLVKNQEVYDEALKSLQDVRQMVTSVKQNADAIKSLPVVRSYVVDANKELIRPDCKRDRRWYSEDALFEPGRAVLTERGRKYLDAAGPWLNEHKEEGSEIVVAAVSGPNQNPEFAQTLTQKQSEVVAEYLKAHFRVQRTGFWWWSNRTVRAVGCGVNAPPVPEAERLPQARVEVIVFVPQQ